MARKIHRQFSEDAYSLLRDIFVFELEPALACEKHLTTLKHLQQLVQQLFRRSIYDRRRDNHLLSSLQIHLDVHAAELLVWREFLNSEISAGKNSLQIAHDTNQSLVRVNSFF